MKHCTKPCPECPFARSIAPGALGGSTPDVYIGQAHGPFMLPCHMASGYSSATAGAHSPQCAGAAIFRANVGVDARMPRGIHKLPADTEAVFATDAEFVAHHSNVSVDIAEELLGLLPPHVLTIRELRKAEVRVIDVPKEAA